MTFDSDAILAEAEAELEARLVEQEELAQKINGLRQVINGLRQVKGEEPLQESTAPPPPMIPQNKLTEACRRILESSEALTPVQLRAKLDEGGFDFSKYSSNPLSAIHTILRRLIQSRVIAAKQIDGKMHYEWQRTTRRNFVYGHDANR
jgi:metal-dependent amidase/aminoacylase/carboxypeptidase family protein